MTPGNTTEKETPPVRLEFNNDINPFAVFLNAFPLAGSVSGIVQRIQLQAHDGTLPVLVVLTVVLAANFIRLSKRTIRIEVHPEKIVYRSMFGWKKNIEIDSPSGAFFVIRSENPSLQENNQQDRFARFKDGIKAVFNLERSSNLYYKNRLICKGVRQ